MAFAVNDLSLVMREGFQRLYEQNERLHEQNERLHEQIQKVRTCTTITASNCITVNWYDECLQCLCCAHGQSVHMDLCMPS